MGKHTVSILFFLRSFYCKMARFRLRHLLLYILQQPQTPTVMLALGILALVLSPLRHETLHVQDKSLLSGVVAVPPRSDFDCAECKAVLDELESMEAKQWPDWLCNAMAQNVKYAFGWG